MVNNKPPAPSPWGPAPTFERTYGRYTPADARAAYQKLIAEVRAQELDERHATETYNKLAEMAENLGEARAAQTFRMISDQEAKHQQDLQFIIEALEMQLKEVH
jgi:rubrerythrin